MVSTESSTEICAANYGVGVESHRRSTVQATRTPQVLVMLRPRNILGRDEGKARQKPRQLLEARALRPATDAGTDLIDGGRVRAG